MPPNAARSFFAYASPMPSILVSDEVLTVFRFAFSMRLTVKR
jgi:hypothetical protein